MSINHKHHIFKLVLSAMFLAMAMVFPLITGQISELGNAFLPMHIPILLCGFFCGPIYGVTLGALAPYLRFILFGAPTLMPIGIAMSFELATYGLMAGLLYKHLRKNTFNTYLTLLISMISGRIIWGIARIVLYDLGKVPFGWEAFLSGALLMAIPGIVIQIALIPPLVILLRKVYPKLGE